MEISELRVLEAAIEGDIQRRPKDMRLPHGGTRFRAVRSVTVDGATYVRVADTDAVVPLHVWRGAIEKDDVISLNYEPPIEASTHCSLLPDRYDHYEAAFVESRFREDPGYIGYAFSISYVQLDDDFEWLPPDAAQNYRSVRESVMAAWLEAQTGK
jgi:hypothetical protein